MSSRTNRVVRLERRIVRLDDSAAPPAHGANAGEQVAYSSAFPPDFEVQRRKPLFHIVFRHVTRIDQTEMTVRPAAPGESGVEDKPWFLTPDPPGAPDSAHPWLGSPCLSSPTSHVSQFYQFRRARCACQIYSQDDEAIERPTRTSQLISAERDTVPIPAAPL